MKKLFRSIGDASVWIQSSVLLTAAFIVLGLWAVLRTVFGIDQPKQGRWARWQEHADTLEDCKAQG